MIAGYMHRCVHMYLSGWQCQAEALDGSAFCEDHISEPEYARLSEDPLRKFALRLVALILLILFLIPFYYTAKALYLGPGILTEEGR
jgi:hypothetical protein